MPSSAALEPSPVDPIVPDGAKSSAPSAAAEEEAAPPPANGFMIKMPIADEVEEEEVDEISGCGEVSVKEEAAADYYCGRRRNLAAVRRRRPRRGRPARWGR